MSLKATIFKVELEVSDIRRKHYRTYNLTVARHPSETDVRMMLRILAFALYADGELTFTRGLCVESEPELWIQAPDGKILLWIELGQPAEKRLRKACSRAGEVVVLSYGDNKADAWWRKNAGPLGRYDNLTVLHISHHDVLALGGLVRRPMQLQASLDEERVWLANGDTTLEILPKTWKAKF